MVEFSDFQCPACGHLEAAIRETRKKFPDDFALVYRHFPLKSHRFARDASIASECAARQGKFAEMHKALFDMQDSIGNISWARFAAIGGVPDSKAFTTCMKDSTVATIVDSDLESGRTLGVKGTPTILINGMRWTGSLDQATLDSVVQAALKKAKTPYVGVYDRRTKHLEVRTGG